MEQLRILVTGNWEEDAIARHMVDPFLHQRASLLFRHRLSVRLAPAATLAELDRVLATADADVVFATSHWRNPVEETLAVFRRAARRPDRPALVYLDYFDQTTSPFFGLLEYVDLYVKKQVYRNRADYARPSTTGYAFADFVAEQYDMAPGDWHFGSPLPAAHAHKLMTGWNLVTANELRRLLRLSAVQRVLPARRHIDVHCRVSVGQPRPEWWYYHRHRTATLSALEPLRARHRVVTSDGSRVGYLQFLNELRHSRIGVSPFGWGEITYRDFQCIACDTLLVKPDVSHLETLPDLFVPYETYVPVAWDLSDLVAQCEYYLAHEAERQRIVRQARERLTAFLREDGPRQAVVQAVQAALANARGGRQRGVVPAAARLGSA